jgi:hypothetical protein
MLNRGRGAVVVATLVALAACTTPTQRSDGPPREAREPEERPTRITIRPDDYHVPWAGTAEDGRRFFLSRELFEPGGSSYVGLFLWEPDGTFDEIKVDAVRRPRGVPAGQAAAAGADELVERRLAELGDYTLEPITVEPFTEEVDGVTFGWKVRSFEGTHSVFITPGDFIAYYAPWNGRHYDT